jgi:hypothetical protein
MARNHKQIKTQTMQKKVIKLTSTDNETILIGVGSIIEVKSKYREDMMMDVSIIRSLGAMISTNYVKESIEEIYNLINN